MCRSKKAVDEHCFPASIAFGDRRLKKLAENACEQNERRHSMDKMRRNLRVSYLCLISAVMCLGGNANGEVFENSNHTKELAEKYQIPEATVIEMRNEHQGWGEIETQLALAERLFQKDPVTYPEFEDALNRVEGMRDDGKGYGQIAHELGFKLGDVVSDAKTASPREEGVMDDEKRETLDSLKENKEDMKAIRKNSKSEMKNAKENAKAFKDEAKEIGREARENAKSSREAAREAKDSAKAFRDAAKEARKEVKEHNKSNKS